MEEQRRNRILLFAGLHVADLAAVDLGASSSWLTPSARFGWPLAVLEAPWSEGQAQKIYRASEAVLARLEKRLAQISGLGRAEAMGCGSFDEWFAQMDTGRGAHEILCARADRLAPRKGQTPLQAAEQAAKECGRLCSGWLAEELSVPWLAPARSELPLGPAIFDWTGIGDYANYCQMAAAQWEQRELDAPAGPGGRKKASPL